MQDTRTLSKPTLPKTVSAPKGRLNLAAMRRERSERRGDNEISWGWLF